MSAINPAIDRYSYLLDIKKKKLRSFLIFPDSLPPSTNKNL